MVSATETSSAPISSNVAVISATFAGDTSGPSYGQPIATDTYPRTRISRDFARATIGLHRSSDSAIVQLVFALENASVAAVKRDTSIELDDPEDLSGCIPLSLPDVPGGISVASSVEVIGPCFLVPLPSPAFGDGGGVRICSGLSEDVIGVSSVSVALRKFWRPLRLGTRKLYAIGAGAAGGRPRR